MSACTWLDKRGCETSPHHDPQSLNLHQHQHPCATRSSNTHQPFHSHRLTSYVILELQFHSPNHEVAYLQYRNIRRIWWRWIPIQSHLFSRRPSQPSPSEQASSPTSKEYWFHPPRQTRAARLGLKSREGRSVRPLSDEAHLLLAADHCNLLQSSSPRPR